MVGIAEMFSEYSGEDQDWFQMAFCFEAAQAHRAQKQRERDAALRFRKALPQRGARGRPRREQPLTVEQIRERNMKYQLEWQARNRDKLRAYQRARYAKKCAVEREAV